MFAYPAAVRVLAGALVAVSRGSLPAIAAGILTAEAPVPVGVLVRVLTVLALLPGLAARAIQRAVAVDVEVRSDAIVVEGRRRRVEIPSSSIERIAPWRVPLPGPGFGLRMRSGHRLPEGLHAADPTPVLSALATAGGIDAAAPAIRHPILVYAHAKEVDRSSRRHRPLAKFAAFALVPTAVMFNAHQHIAFGGLLGQYYLEGPGPYFRTFGIYWALAAIYLLLYASVWRAAAEAVALLSAAVAPSRAASVRRAVEITCTAAYYVGVPVIVLLPFVR